MSEFWKTSISRVKTDEILVRGYPIEELTRRCSFGDVVCLLMKGELPGGNEGRMIEAMLVACCEHSLASPSVDAVRFVASCGVPLQTAVAAGVSAIGDVHGGAIEPCARLLRDAVAAKVTANEAVEAARRERRRLPGYGHSVHKRDPRVVVLFELGEALGVAGAHTALARAIEGETERILGRRFNLNVDGAIAALICDMGIDPLLGKIFFIISRAPGYGAHAREQMQEERPFKAAAPEEITYTGPERRGVPENFGRPGGPKVE